ncbi:hypothetical protein [Thalassotalea sp. G2M2-11]|uniref:hypothetical protein n=1 Tax=Thalassotalea sp. G2M2-11 TaxID=2787627 RepID=UPI0019D15EF7|nr:hypothetical protein [Thalassotalea sp. G2M2-11]
MSLIILNKGGVMCQTKQNKSMGIAISMGAGIGMILGRFVFDDPGIGLVVGAVLGVVYASFGKTNQKNDNK